MEEIVRNAVSEVCRADPHLGAEWHELLGLSTPSADDARWTELLARIAEVADSVGTPTEGLGQAIVDNGDVEELRAAIASVVWPEVAEPAAVAESEQGPEGIAAEMAQEDPDAWNTYLRTNGASWDGNDESWPAFVEWFLYYANEQGVGASARTFCDYATANGPREVLAQYGVTVAAPATAGEPGTAAPEMTVDQAVAAFGPDVFAEFRKQNPELADISDEELQVMMAEVLASQGA
ncbi:hypothetical protein [Actinophytocola xanthii]|uniref:Uncharacterized protein n=1 Tax=Actinophytocola xanthii TaxID=1912961 RepID=A0A1Q8CJZ0_9PSEU|nr:hypothetical protein [Actinophytocola xanthii]OLF14671.1 hypothetical protein BU204_25920 [Actinophytocola xanthii]